MSQIKSLKNEAGIEAEWDTGLEELMINYFKELFKATNTDWDEVVRVSLPLSPQRKRKICCDHSRK